MLLPFQGATAPTRDTQGVASLALGYVLHWAFSPSLLNPKPQSVASLALGYVQHWAFIDIIGCGSAIQASLIAFALHDDSARTCTHASTTLQLVTRLCIGSNIASQPRA